MAFYQALKATGSPILKAAYHPWIRGKENIPAEGPAILASNHNAVWDSVFLPMMLDREVVFMGKADYFTGTGVKGWMTKEFMRAVGTIPVDRTGGRASESALNAGLKRLRSGELFGIYPEGTRSPDGRLYRGKTGVARLALLSGAPVIPVAMIGTHTAQPIGQRIPSRTNIGMVIGEPLDFSRYRGLDRDRYVLRAITDEIMYNFTGTGVKGWMTKEFMRAVGTIPVDRTGGRASESALNAGLKRLRSGELFGIYPEGTRSPDGRLYRGKTGVARLALLSGAPVIPVAMIGTHTAQPIGQRIPSRTNIGMVIGEPLDFSRYRGLDRDRYVLRAITDEIMYNLMLLSGQEYVDLYAADVKAQLAAEGAFEGPVPSNGRPAPGGRTAPDVPVPTAPEEEPSEEENKEDSSK